jgi:membrane fusion protein (multidrug efflux system)
VIIGGREPGLVEILSCLNPGDVVVTAGQMKLHEGVSVSSVTTPQEP